MISSTSQGKARTKGAPINWNVSLNPVFIFVFVFVLVSRQFWKTQQRALCKVLARGERVLRLIGAWAKLLSGYKTMPCHRECKMKMNIINCGTSFAAGLRYLIRGGEEKNQFSEVSETKKRLRGCVTGCETRRKSRLKHFLGITFIVRFKRLFMSQIFLKCCVFFLSRKLNENIILWHVNENIFLSLLS